MPPSTKSVLVIDPDDDAGAAMQRALRGAGMACRLAGDAEAGWREFVHAPADAVVTALSTPRRDGAWLLRRLRDEYIGTPPPVYALATEADVGATTRELELDAVLIQPVAPQTVVDLVGRPMFDDAPARQAARLRELFEVTLLAGDLDAVIKVFIDRIALAFRVADCILWGPAHEDRWPVSRRKVAGPDEFTNLLWRCDLAITAGVAVVATDAGRTSTYLGVPLEAPGASAVGALCLIDDGPRRFSADEIAALRSLGRRLALELAWRSAHERLAAEHDRLRETAVLDPLLGVWTRAALEEAATAEISRARAASEDAATLAVAVAILDVEQLRQINERYGHVAGDAALAHLAQVVNAHVRAQDLLGRVAGDELGLLLPGILPHDAQTWLQELGRTIASSRLVHQGIEIEVRVTIGATALAPGEETGDQLLARAAAALRDAKRARVPFQWAAVEGLEILVPLEDVDVPDILPPGATLGGMYKILHEISRGAMGVVYRAEDMGLGRPVAVKVLRADLARDAALVARFRAEAAMLAALHHENLVDVYTFGQQGDDVYFVMELVEGESLGDLLGRADDSAEPVAIDLIAALVTQVAGALDAMHRAGALHRDVKPSNILLDRVRDRAVLVDVGVAKRRGAGVDAAGTPGFAAPESFTSGEEGPATDVYGLAATSYMLLTGLAPFGGGDVAKVVRRQLNERPAAPSALRADLARNVDRVLLRALGRGPAERYQSAVEFAHALGEALAEAPDPAVADTPGTAMRRAILAAAQEGGAPTTTRRLAKALDLDEPRPPPPSIGSSRGALFRVAYKILGNRLGSPWARGACERDPTLAEVLRPTVAPLAWYPVERLIGLLHSVPADAREPRKVARELGRATMTATFARFFGTDPASLSPAEVMAAADVFWSRYHTWGRLTVFPAPSHALITITDTPRDPLLCLMLEGAFERIAELAGGGGVQASHVACEADGANGCTYEVRWIGRSM